MKLESVERAVMVAGAPPLEVSEVCCPLKLDTVDRVVSPTLEAGSERVVRDWESATDGMNSRVAVGLGAYTVFSWCS